MLLYTRRTRLVGGSAQEGLTWAVSAATKVTEVTGHNVRLWTTVFGPGVGTVTWTAWFDDMTALETLGDKLQADPAFVTLASSGAKFTDGTLDDAVYMPIH